MSIQFSSMVSTEPRQTVPRDGRPLVLSYAPGSCENDAGGYAAGLDWANLYQSTPGTAHPDELWLTPKMACRLHFAALTCIGQDDLPPHLPRGEQHWHGLDSWRSRARVDGREWSTSPAPDQTGSDLSFVCGAVARSFWRDSEIWRLNFMECYLRIACRCAFNVFMCTQAFT